MLHYFFTSLFLVFSICSFGQQRVNLGPLINGPLDETHPLFSPDGNTIYYSKGNPDGGEDAMSAERTGDNSWSNPKEYKYGCGQKNLDKVLLHVSEDKSSFIARNPCSHNGDSFMYKIKKGKHQYRGKYYVSKNIRFPSDYQHTHRCSYISPNAEIFIMSFKTKGQERSDLYISFKINERRITPPKRLNSVINTEYSELAPFLTENGRTLYFSSDRPGGLGKEDIYVTHRIGDSWDNWTEPENLGAPVNTTESETHYVIQDGKAYFSSSYSSYGGLDLFTIEHIDKKKFVTGKLMRKDLDYDASLTGRVTSYDANTNEKLDSANITYGHYALEVDPSRDLILLFESDEYFPHEIYISKESLENSATQDHPVYLEIPWKENPIILDGVLFHRGTTTLIDSSFKQLNLLLRFMNTNPDKFIELAGHTDNVGDPDVNMQLSLDRVIKIRKFLIDKGIDSTRITYKAYGQTRPIASNLTEGTRKLNRRVEFSVIE